MKIALVYGAALLAAACGGTQSTHTETPAAQPSPAYTTSPGAATGQGQHTMPDGTTMAGDHHGHDADAGVTSRDGGTTQDHAHDHAPAGTHVMPDGAVMQGSHPGAGH